MEMLFVIDDDSICQFILGQFLRKNTFFENVCYYENAQNVIKYLTKNTANSDLLPDAILLEVQLPFFSGWEFLNELNSIYSSLAKDVLVYIVTTIVWKDIKLKAELYPFVAGVFQKPFTKNILLQIEQDVQRCKVENIL